MIKVVLKQNSIVIKGHAHFDKYGKDIVCAAASASVLTSINAILRFNNNDIEVIEGNGILEIKIINHNDIVDTILNNMISMLRELEKDYKDNIVIKEE